MVNSFHEYKVESLKAERYTLQSSNPVHPSKNMPYLFLYIHACKKSLLFVTREWHLNYLSKLYSSEILLKMQLPNA